jgi:hypothetical protein
MVLLLQLQGPGLTELGIIVSLIALFAAAGVVVYRDAKQRGNDRALLWGLGVPLLGLFGGVPGILVIVGYYLTRD